MPLLRSYLCIYDGLQHTSAASSSPSIILSSVYGRNFLPLAYSLQKIGAHMHIDEDGKIIVDVMHWYELNSKALYGLMSLVYCAVYTWIYINGLVDYICMTILTRWSRLRHRVHTIQMHNNTVPCNNQLRTRKDYAAINNMQQSTWTV